jgi:hypothetical protein
VVKISKMLAKTSVEDEETHPKAKNKKCKRKTETEPAKGSRRKDKKKKKSQAEGKNVGRKTVFWLGASVFSCLGLGDGDFRSLGASLPIGLGDSGSYCSWTGHKPGSGLLGLAPVLLGQIHF